VNQDLFVEQLLLCSMTGYEELLSYDWFNIILTWQHPEYGCISNASETNRFYRHTKRHSLSEQIMSNGCLSHKSGLAAGLSATYSRIFYNKKLADTRVSRLRNTMRSSESQFSRNRKFVKIK
ncbi:unnamed protein product, partial [Didymodactylos carnosus]